MNVNTNAAPNLGGLQSRFQQRAQNFKDLESSLSNGDLSGVQAAFSAITQGGPNGANGRHHRPDPNSTVGKDFKALESALKSGDVNAAKEAFATLKTDMKAARGAHGPEGAGHAHRPDNDGDDQQVGSQGPVDPQALNLGLGVNLDEKA